jgi:thioredoxin type arsenate reductase
MDRKSKILFFSTGDSTRSQMAEGFLRTLTKDNLIPVSTAVRSPKLDPLAIEVMQEVGIDISDQHAKDIAESLKDHFACVVTVCDAVRERFPVWPFTRNIFHWNLADPAAVQGSVEQRRQVFRSVRDQISRNVSELVTLTLPRLHIPA